MSEYVNRVKTLAKELSESQEKKLKTSLLHRLLEKIDAELTDDLRALSETTLQHLSAIVREEAHPKEYKRAFQTLRKEVRSKLGYTAKDQLKEESIAMGIAIGVAFGGAFLSIGPAFIGAGLPIGLAIGVAIGQSKEQKAEEQGKTY